MKIQKKLKEIAPGIYGTPGVFSDDFLKSLPRDYKSPPGGTFNVNTMKQAKGKSKKEVEALLAKKKEEEKKKRRRRA